MLNCEIYFPIFSETIHKNLKFFHSTILGSVGRGCCKKNRVLDILTKVFVYVVSVPLTGCNVFSYSPCYLLHFKLFVSKITEKGKRNYMYENIFMRV